MPLIMTITIKLYNKLHAQYRIPANAPLNSPQLQSHRCKSKCNNRLVSFFSAQYNSSHRHEGGAKIINHQPQVSLAHWKCKQAHFSALAISVKFYRTSPTTSAAINKKGSVLVPDILATLCVLCCCVALCWRLLALFRYYCCLHNINFPRFAVFSTLTDGTVVAFVCET